MLSDLGKKYYNNRSFCLTGFTIDTLVFDHHDHLTMYISKPEGAEICSAMVSLTYAELDKMLMSLGRKGYETELLIAEILSSGEDLPAIVDINAKFEGGLLIDKCTLNTKLFCMSMSDNETDMQQETKEGSHDKFYCFVVTDVKLN